MLLSFINLIIFIGIRGSVLVEALGYKPEGRGFDSRLGFRKFSLTSSLQPHNGPATGMSFRDLPRGVKSASVLGRQPYHLHVLTGNPGSLKLLEPSGPVQGELYLSPNNIYQDNQAMKPSECNFVHPLITSSWPHFCQTPSACGLRQGKESYPVPLLLFTNVTWCPYCHVTSSRVYMMLAITRRFVPVFRRRHFVICKDSILVLPQCFCVSLTIFMFPPNTLISSTYIINSYFPFISNGHASCTSTHAQTLCHMDVKRSSGMYQECPSVRKRSWTQTAELNWIRREWRKSLGEVLWFLHRAL
jgi:hypothetical protein